MADWGHKTRYSIAAFRSQGELDAAVCELVAAGFADDQIGLAAAESSVLQQPKPARDAAAAPVSDALRALIDRFEPSAYQVAGATILVSEIAPGQLAACFASADAAQPQSGLSAATRGRLLAQIYAGAWLLGANAHSYEQLRAGTRILLAHSSDRVETFELHAL